jgi:hypothetical protein
MKVMLGLSVQAGPGCRQVGKKALYFCQKAKARSKEQGNTTENTQDQQTTMIAQGTKERQGLK